MRVFFRLILLITFIGLSTLSYANDSEEVSLIPNEVYLLDVPEPIEDVVEDANRYPESTSARQLENHNCYQCNYMDQKIEKTINKLINNKVTQKGVKILSTDIGD